jgi:hypothetical protein
MAIFEILEQCTDWRGRVRITAEPGDALAGAGLSVVEVELKDTLPHPHVPETARQAQFFDVNGAALYGPVLVPPPPPTTELERQARIALDGLLAARSKD